MRSASTSRRSTRPGPVPRATSRASTRSSDVELVRARPARLRPHRHRLPRRVVVPGRPAAPGKRERLDVLHCPTFRGPISPPGMPLVVTVHDLAVLRHPETFNRWTRHYSRSCVPRVARAASRIIAVSEFTKREARRAARHARRRRSRSSPTAWPTSSRRTARRPTATTCSRWERSSRGRTSSACRRRLAWPAWSCGSSARAAGAAWRLPAGSGRCPTTSSRVSTGARKCVVYASLYEGFGLPIAEAMACGTPVVTSRGGATEETAGGAAVLVDPYDPAAIAAGIAEASSTTRRAAPARPRARPRLLVGRGGRARRPTSTARWPHEPRRHRRGRARPPADGRRDVRPQPPAPPARRGRGRLRFAALTRRPDLVPEGVEAVHVPARFQELRMAWSVPRVLRRLRPALAHFQHALPLRCPCPAVVTIHDLSFERDPSVMPLRDRARLQDGRAALGQARRARPRRVRADEGRRRRAVRHPAGEDHRDAARRGSRVLAGRRQPRRVRVVGGICRETQEPAGGGGGRLGGRAAARRRRAGARRGAGA